MPGKHYVASGTVGRPADFDYYFNSMELKPENVIDGDRGLEYDTGKTYVWFKGDWHAEPAPTREVLDMLEEIRNEVAKQTPTAEALLDKL